MRSLWIIVCTILFAVIIPTHVVSAGNFAGVMMRSERTKVGLNPTPILVEVTPATLGTENKLTFQLDSRLTSGTHFSTTAGDYTTDTSDLPAGFTALPLSSATATNVSGQTVTFGINDLTVGTSYAFYITGGFPVNPAATQYMTIMSTATSGDVVIDTQNVWTETHSNDQITITATVPPAQGDFNLSVDTDAPLTVDQHAVLTYTLFYSSGMTSSTPLTLQAQWYQGTIEGASSPSVDVVSYQAGSSTKAYGEIEAIIDLSRNTITWTIPSLPSGVGEQSVSFQLKTRDSYTGGKKVVFPVRARITHPSSVTDMEVLRTYVYTQESSITPSTPVPTPFFDTSAPVTITSIQPRTITPTSLTIDVETSAPILLTTLCGQDRTRLGNTVVDPKAVSRHSVTLPNLTPNTKYYFRFYALIDGELRPLSEIFTLQTALQTTEGNTGPLLLSASEFWGNLFLALGGQTQTSVPQLISAVNQVVDLEFAIPGSAIQTATVFIQDAQVLGITSADNTEYQTSQSTAMQIGPTLFATKILLPATKGTYALMLKTNDVYGNMQEYQLARVLTVLPLKVTDLTGKPVEGAQILLSKYNEQTKLFDVIPDSAMSLHNPMFSDEVGVVTTPFFTGKYEAIISKDGFETQKLVYTINPKQDEDLPQVILLYERDGALGSIERSWKDFLSRSYTFTVFSEVSLLILLITLGNSLIILLTLRRRFVRKKEQQTE